MKRRKFMRMMSVPVLYGIGAQSKTRWRAQITKTDYPGRVVRPDMAEIRRTGKWAG